MSQSKQGPRSHRKTCCENKTHRRHTQSAGPLLEMQWYHTHGDIQDKKACLNLQERTRMYNLLLSKPISTLLLHFQKNGA